jgi:hypothetical protein
VDMSPEEVAWWKSACANAEVITVSAEEWDFIQNLPDELPPDVADRLRGHSGQA